MRTGEGDGPPAAREQLSAVIRRFGGRLVVPAEIAARIEAARGGRDWRWMVRWAAEEGPRWANDPATVVFEVPLANLPPL